MKNACLAVMKETYLHQQHATGATSLSDQCKVHGDCKRKPKIAIVLALSWPPTVHLLTKVTECIIYIHWNDSDWL